MPIIPADSFEENKNVEPIKSAEDKILPESKVLDFDFFCNN